MTNAADETDWEMRAILALIGLSMLITAIFAWGDVLVQAKYISEAFWEGLLVIFGIAQLLLALWVDIAFLGYSFLKKVGFGLLIIVGVGIIGMIYGKDATLRIIEDIFRQPFYLFIWVVIVFSFLASMEVIQLFGEMWANIFFSLGEAHKAKKNYLFYAMFVVLAVICLAIVALWPFKSETSS